MKLNQLKDNKGAKKRRMRVGRGIGSGKGKTCGRGGKGQTARTGVAINGFEGGQTPMYMRLPKRGFWNPTRTLVESINTGELETKVKAGKLDAKKPVNREALEKAGLVRKTGSKIKILAKGEIKSKLEIHADLASKTAVEAVAKAGGKVVLPEVKEQKAA